MKKWRQRIVGLLAALLLLCGMGLSAQGAAYSDLPPTHWAYAEITRAASYEIMNGVTETLMQPNGTLTWAQYLAMICRAFAPDQYWGMNRSQGIPWDTAAWETARSIGVLTDMDFLPVTAGSMRTTPISRQDVAVLLNRVLPERQTSSSFDGWFTGGQYSIGGEINDPWAAGGESIDPWAAPQESVGAQAGAALTDFYQMDENHRSAVSRLYDQNIIRGKADGSFGPADTIRRCDGAVLLIRTLDRVDSLRRGERRSIQVTVQDEAGNSLASRTVETYVGQDFQSLASLCCPEGYKASTRNSGSVSVATSRCTLFVSPMSQSELAYNRAYQARMRGEMTNEEYEAADFWLKMQGDNPRKCLLLFGDANWDRYQVYETAEEAESNMTSVQVPVWKLRNGKKSQGTMSLTVHKALAQDVTEIFTEIFNDPEQFPVESVGGYRYREGSTSEHTNGTAIDINADENYQIRDGVIETGSCWEPGVNPYSIPVDGSVVRIFAEHGWSWGGDAWAGHADDSTGYHDYMHFSYRGR